MKHYIFIIRVFFVLLFINTFFICFNGFSTAQKENRSLMYLKTYKDYLRRKNDTSEVETIIFNVYSSSELDSFKINRVRFDHFSHLEAFHFEAILEDSVLEVQFLSSVTRVINLDLKSAFKHDLSQFKNLINLEVSQGCFNNKSLLNLSTIEGLYFTEYPNDISSEDPLFHLKNVHRIRVLGSPTPIFYHYLSHYTKLKNLNISTHSNFDFPDTWSDLKELESILIHSHGKLCNLSVLGEMSQLKSIVLTSSEMDDLTESLCSLQFLKEFYILTENFISIPKCVLNPLNKAFVMTIYVYGNRQKIVRQFKRYKHVIPWKERKQRLRVYDKHQSIN